MSQPTQHQPRRFFEITFTRTAHYVSVKTVEARTLEGAQEIAEHIVADGQPLSWDRIGNEIDVLSVDEVELGGEHD